MIQGPALKIETEYNISCSLPVLYLTQILDRHGNPQKGSRL